MRASRRVFLCGCCAALAGAPGVALARAPRVCSLRGMTASARELSRLPRTPWADWSATQEILPVTGRFETLFGATAQVSVLTGPDAPDSAFAVDGQTRAPNQVLLGAALIDRYRDNLPNWWRVAVVGVIAHEYAHLWQMANAPDVLAEARPHKYAELHADYLSGYALSLFKREQNIQIGAFAQELFALGDLSFNSPTHHGTPDERMAAMIEGYRIGIQPASPPSLEEAAAGAVAFLDQAAT